MNRRDMAEEIEMRLLGLADEQKDELKRAERLRLKFVRDYPIDRIEALSLDKYVVGRGKPSFCYRLERELQCLGSILGNTSFKFGVYFGRVKSDPSRRFRFSRKWGSNLDSSFVAVKRAIESLLEAANRGDREAIAQSKLTPMFKGKLLALYQPNDFAPIYSKDHLTHFVTELNLPGTLNDEQAMQRALMTYRATWPQFMAHSPVLYMNFLYLALPPTGGEATGKRTSPKVPKLSTAVSGVQLLTSLPAAPNSVGGLRNALMGHVDFEERNGQTKRIGDRGEHIVLEWERTRLLKAGRPDLSARVKHVAVEEGDGAGYDILSFDDDGKERPVEVKSTSADHMGRGFFLSANELKHSRELPNYTLYLVFSAMSTRPKLLTVKTPQFGEPEFTLKPITFLVSLGVRRRAAVRDAASGMADTGA